MRIIYNASMVANDVFRIGKFELTNRLFVGTGKYSSYEIMQQALDASGCFQSMFAECIVRLPGQFSDDANPAYRAESL